MIRIGQGYDVHKLVAGRKLILGGTVIPHNQGLLGHSDADVLTHAVMDALLGAAGLGDIGMHFPDDDPKYKNADSLLLLTEVGAHLREAGFRTGNIDATVVAQAPKLSAYRQDMRRNLAAALGLLPEQVNVKFTTEEGLGFTGNGEGMAAWAVALVENI